MSVVQDIVLPHGEDRAFFAGPFVQEDAFGVDQPVDLTAAGTKMWFTVKQNLADADVDAILQKTEAAGITLDLPNTADNNWASIEVAAADWPVDHPGPILYYDIQLKHNGKITTPFRGLVRCPQGVTAATS